MSEFIQSPVTPSPHRVSTLTSPRLRPGGPRTRKNTPRSVTPLALNGLLEEHEHPQLPPSHPTSSRPSPTFSSNAGSISSPYDRVSQLSSPSIYPEEEAPAPRSWNEQGVQVSPEERPPPTPSVDTRSSTPAVKVIAKPPSLTPPPALNFDPVPIQWRGMTLESAQWSMDQAQLQEVVSRAIRRTAQESFIRLLSLKTLDEELVAELERLDTLKATAQAQYRFNMHRRTMLLQSLLTLAGGDGDYTALGSLITQIAEVTAACDGLMLELVRVADQRAQIQRLQDVHVSSALAMALRKLNTSYAKRTGELREAREQMDTLKAELEEAWKVAEDMAQEMDDLDNFHSGFSSGSEPEEDDTRMDESVRLAEVIGVTGKAVAMKATLTQLHADRAKERNDLENRSQRVSAARKRSSRQSKASLRLPKSSRTSVPPSPAADVTTSSNAPSSYSRRARSRSRSRAGSLRHWSDGEPDPSAPPVPAIVVDTASLKKGPKNDSFLEMAETRPVSPATPVALAFPPPLPTAIDARTATARPVSVDPALARSPPLDFEVPHIAISPADGGDAVSYKSSRRVQSYQPPSRSQSVEPDRNLKRASADYKKFDGWPFPGGGSKAARRRSLPLSSSPNIAPAATPPPRVFSPPPPT